MKKPLAASKSLMQNYLAELLTEDPQDLEPPTKQQAKAGAGQVVNKPLDANKQKLNKLLQQANVANSALSNPVNGPVVSTAKSTARAQVAETNSPLAKPALAKAPLAKAQVNTKQQSETDQQSPTEPLVSAKRQAKLVVKSEKNYRKGNFQAMFFDVAGLLVAVPLIELGGIHQIDKITSLVGKPAWYKGVMLHREDKINVVDTALWVMPEKCNEKLLNSLAYQYIIMLGTTAWGMMAENLVDTVTLQQDDVKWLDNNVRRPWLAGLVKDRMCALLDVDALIKMLDDGAKSR